MGIDMRGFRVVYKGRVYNALDVQMVFVDAPSPGQETGFHKPKFLDVALLNEDGEICFVHDEAFMFQFIRITNGAGT